MPPIVSELPNNRMGPSGLGMTPSIWSTGVDVAFWSYGNEITPVTEITSLSTAGSDMPLTSPSELLSALLLPLGHRAGPASASATAAAAAAGRGGRAPGSQRRAEMAGGGDRRDPFLQELVIRVLERDHDLRIILVGIHFGLERLRRTERERGCDHAVNLARPERVVHERVLDDVLQAVVEKIG